MGKTKTAFIAGVEEEKKTSQQKYAEKIAKKKALEEAQNDVKETEKVPTEEVVNEESSLPENSAKVEEKKQVRTKRKEYISVRGKKYLGAKTKIDNSKKYTLEEGIKLIKSIKFSNFDETMELHLVVKKVSTTATVTLPNSFGKGKKVVVADDKLITQLEDGKIDFDVLLATPEMMPKLVKFARVLGPKGLMPNPKNGTVINSVKDAEKFSADALNLKTEKEAPLIHTAFGKASMDDKKLVENAETIIKELNKNKQIVKAFLKSTMSPSVKIQL